MSFTDHVNYITRAVYNELMANFEDLKKLDKHHIFDEIDVQPDQLRLNFADSMADKLSLEMGLGIKNIVFAGMGGSALAGTIVKNWLGGQLLVPLEVVRGYDLPGYVGNGSLVVVSSASGNTEEALSALKQALRLNAQVVVMSSGGLLEKAAKERVLLEIELQHYAQPRLGVFADVKALACVLENLGLAGKVDMRRELEDVASFLDTQKAQWNLDAKDDNVARKIAKGLHGKPALIYAGPTLAAAAYKWKIDINENAKQMANANVYPELNHNEMQGWLFPEAKHLQVVELHSSLDHPRIKKRFVVTRQVLAKHGYEPIEVEVVGNTHIQQLLSTILLGDYVSAYLGILNGIDPTPVELVEKFKKELG